MTIFILEKTASSLRGDLTRWMLEPKTGVFIGHISAMVREKLWGKIQKNSYNSAGIMIWSTNSEQGFDIKTFGITSRNVHDWDGLLLVSKP